MLVVACACAGWMAEGRAAVASATSATVGPVEVECADAKGWTFSLETAPSADGEVLTLRAESPKEMQPPEFNVKFAFSGADVRYVWTSDFMRRSFTLWPSRWNEGKR